MKIVSCIQLANQTEEMACSTLYQQHKCSVNLIIPCFITQLDW